MPDCAERLHLVESVPSTWRRWIARPMRDLIRRSEAPVACLLEMANHEIASP